MSREPIAIVGIGCRFPGGVDSPATLVELLDARRSAICDVPPDRWDADAFFHPDFRKPGRVHVKRGGFLSAIADFDAAFFGISPNEARRMDPQQRLILETCFEAIEDAGIPLERLAGRRIAVAIGAGLRDYDAVLGAPSERVNIAATTNTGSALSIIANRVSYLFDLRGPSFAVDTACSSSLTALHHACRSIWEDGAEAALCGGVNAMLKPEITMGFSKGGYLSPDAECRAFSADANGYVRSEGAAVIVLKPLARAIADGDRVYASIRGTALNQDGRTAGMTVPSVDAQRELLRTAFADAGIDPRTACYIEAHGTGTPTGDPIEATAIGEVVGYGRTNTCFIGSVKTNLGHMECAAGMAGLLKLAMVLDRRRIFANLNFRAPNPKIDFERLHIGVATEPRALPGDGPLFGGVNSFGFGGANGHAVLESPPRADVPPQELTVGQDVLFVAARSEAARRSLAGRIAERIATGDEPVARIAAALARRRSRFEFRTAIAGATREALVAGLARYAETGELAASQFEGRVREGVTEPVAFVFTGQGPQWWAMGRGLLERDATFRAVVTRVDRELQRLGWLGGASLVEELQRDEATSRIGGTEVAQPAIFALQLGLVHVLARHGVEPGAVVGHSIGELAAAVCAGALSLEEGTRIVYWRSRSQALAEGKGAMVAIGVGEAEALRLLAGYRGELDLAAVNGPSAATVAGTHAAVARLVDELAAAQVFHKRLDVSVPFHCHLMDPVEAPFREGLDAVGARAAAVPFYSTVAGGQLAGGELDVDYWYRNIREPVRYQAALAAMIADGWRIFVEIGPNPALARGSVETLQQAGVRGTVIPTLRRDHDDAGQLARTLAQLFVAGAACEVSAHDVVPHVDLPHHPFDRKTYWMETAAGRAARIRPEGTGHPHVSAIRTSVQGADVMVAELTLDPRADGYLADHRVQGHVVFPAAGQLEMCLAAVRLAEGGDRAVSLEDVELRRPIIVAGGDDDAPPELRLEVYGDDGSFAIASRADRDAPWLEHTRGRVQRIPVAALPLPIPLDALRARTDLAEMASGDVYRSCAEAGLELGAPFRGIARYFSDPERGEFFSEIVPPDAIAGDTGFAIHPGVLDSVLQTTLSITTRGTSGAHRLFLPHRVGRIQIHRATAGERLWTYARAVERTDDEAMLDIWCVDDDGAPVVTVEGFVVKYVQGSAAATVELAHELAWRETPRDGEPREASEDVWLVLGDIAAPLGCRLADQLRATRGPVVELDADIDDGDAELRFAIANAARDTRIAGVVHVTCADTRADLAHGPATLARVIAILDDTAAWASRREVWIVTERAQPVAGDRDPALAGAAMWGLGRVLASENARLDVTLVDIDGVDDIPGVAAEIARGPGECEIALRGGWRGVRDLAATPATARTPVPIDVATTPVRATLRVPGIIDSVALEAFGPPAELGPDEVEVAVRAVSLIFRDVVVAMGMLRREAWTNGLAGAEIGSDFAGDVIRVGAGVTDLRPGDRVAGLAPRALATRAIAHQANIRRIPDGLGYREAAAIPTCYLTAAVALNKLARLEPGETILIQAAAGGVGLLAVQLAHRIGAIVIAATSSEDKRAFLRTLGVTRFVSSRRPDFRDEVMRLTGGQGVDVVLNSAAGRAFTEGLRCLKPFGRFVDIGKVDIYKNRQIGLRVFGENRAYFCLDINRYSTYKAGEVAHLLVAGMHERLTGAIAEYPARTFAFEDTAEALRWFASGSQIGKIVIDIPQTGTVLAEPEPRIAFDREAVYVLTGGLGGFGRALARWLVEKGARKLVLASRSGATTREQHDDLAVLASMGAELEVWCCGVSHASNVDELLAVARRRGRIGGVFHLAMTLADGPLATLDHDAFTRVFAPKVDGAVHLDRATRGDRLDHFVMFSSISSVVGTPGQGNYAAANAVLDQLAAQRRARGLAGTSISWGIIGDVGVVARATPQQRKRIESQGVRGIPVARALDELERALLDGVTHRVVVDADWKRLAVARNGRPSRFASLASAAPATSGAQALRDVLAAAPEAERPAVLAATMATLIGKLAGLGDAPVDVDTSIGRYGLDSLMVAQVQSWCDDQLGVSVGHVRLMRGPSLLELARELVAQMARAAAAPAGSSDDAAWLYPIATSDAPKFRLFFFSFMGGNRDAFAAWATELPPDIEAYAVELPALGGERDRFLRGPTEELRRAAVDEIAKLGDTPFGLYGHSLGAYLALDVARDLVRGAARPAFVALGAVPTIEAIESFIPSGVERPEDVTDEMALEALRQMQVGDGVQGRVVERVRRDLWLGVRSGLGRKDALYESIAGVPVILFGGADDPVPTLDKIERQLPVEAVISVPGSHLFQGEAALREHVLARIERAIGAQA